MDFVYRKKVHPDGSATYLAIRDDGYVSFYYYDSNRPYGFDGMRLTLTLEDGTRDELIGPWSSNPDSVRRAFPDCPELVQTIHLGYSCYMTADAYYARQMAGLRV